LKKILKINHELDETVVKDKDGNEITEREKDLKWSEIHEELFRKQIKNVKLLYDNQKEREKTIDLLEDALYKLEHNDLDPESVKINDIHDAMELCRNIKDLANRLESTFYHLEKKYSHDIKLLDKKQRINKYDS